METKQKDILMYNPKGHTSHYVTYHFGTNKKENYGNVYDTYIQKEDRPFIPQSIQGDKKKIARYLKDTQETINPTKRPLRLLNNKKKLNNCSLCNEIAVCSTNGIPSIYSCKNGHQWERKW